MSHRSNRTATRPVPGASHSAQPVRAGRAAPAIVLAAVTLVALAAGALGYALVTAPAASRGAAVPAPSVGPHLVNDFYDAVNDAIATGSTAGLDRLLAPEAASPTAGVGGLDRAALDDRLGCLHALAPRPRIVVVETRPLGQLVLVRTRLEPPAGASPAFLGMPLALGTPGSNDIDLLRIDGRRIAEYWGGAGLPSCAAVAAGPLAVHVPERLAPSLEERTFAASYQGPDEVAPGPFALLVRAGRLRVDVGTSPGADAVLVHAGTGDGERFAAPAPARMVEGDLLLLPAGASFAVHNTVAEAAVALVVTAVKLADPGGAAAVPVTPPAGLTVRSLAWGGSVPLDQAPVIGFGRVALAPGGAIPLHDVSGAEMVVVERGELEFLAAGDPGSVRHTPDGGATVERAARMETGAGSFVDTGSAVEYRNPGPEPAELLVVTIAPPAAT